MKKLLTLALALCLTLCLNIPVFAASMNPSASATQVAPGEEVTVTVTLDEKIEGITTISYRVYFDAALFDLKSVTPGTCTGALTSSGVKEEDGKSYVNISVLDATSEGITLEAGSFALLTFTAKADIEARAEAGFAVVFENCMGTIVDGELTYPKHEAGAPVTVAVAPAVQPPVTAPEETQPPVTTPEAPAQTTAPEASNPGTGDSGMPLLFGFAMVLSLGILAFGYARKRSV